MKSPKSPCNRSMFYSAGAPCASSLLSSLWFCGWCNFLLPLHGFACCLRRVSTTLSFSQHFCLAFLDTLCATCPVPSLLHGKTHSLAPPAASTPLTSPNTPLKNNYRSPKTANCDESTFSSLSAMFFSPLLHGQIVQQGFFHFATPDRQQQRRQRALEPLLSNSLFSLYTTP